MFDIRYRRFWLSILHGFLFECPCPATGYLFNRSGNVSREEADKASEHSRPASRLDGEAVFQRTLRRNEKT
ncbi:hypothetical protein V1523DRAFT_413149 [Lipomyces doorenjongii]